MLGRAGANGTAKPSRLRTALRALALLAVVLAPVLMSRSGASEPAPEPASPAREEPPPQDEPAARPTAPTAKRPRRWRYALHALLLVAVAAVPIIAARANADDTVTYTGTETIPVPPASAYAGSGGGDGWAVALSSTSVFNVFHHDSSLQVACHNQSDAQPCWGETESVTVTDQNENGFASSGQPGLYLDQKTGKLYVYASRDDGTGGVVCFDPANVGTESSPFCGFTALTGVGEAPINGWSNISDPVQVGDKWLAFDFVNGAGVSGAENKLLCFSLTTFSPCSGQPYSVDLALGDNTMDAGQPGPAIAAIDASHVIIPFGVSGSGEVTCFDPGTGTACSGDWPAPVPGGAVGDAGAPVPVLDSSGKATGFCFPTSSPQCLDLSGASVDPPAGLAGAIGAGGGSSVVWNGPAVQIGARIYIPIWSEVDCFDYSTMTKCSNFPNTFDGTVGGLYTVNVDPQRPACLWVNSDSGEIKNFDAFSGEGCGGGNGETRVLASSFVVNAPQCTPGSYTSLQVVSPENASGSVQIEDSSGEPVAGIPAIQIDPKTGIASLADLNLNGLPQFLITLDGNAAAAQQVVVKLTWTGTFDPTCESDTATVVNPPTTSTTGTTEQPQPATVTASGPEGSAEVGTQQCVDAAVADDAGAALSGVAVDFTVGGANSTKGQRSTNSDGIAEFCYTGTNAGKDTVTAAVGRLSDSASVTWTPQPPRIASVTATPKTGSAVVGSEQCVTAAVADQNGGPMQVVAVDFTVTGANSAEGQDSTNSDGNAQFCYAGANTGTDTVRAAAGEFSDSVTRTWVRVAKVTASPKSGRGQVGTPQCVNAAVADQNGSPIDNVRVDFTVTGANAVSGFAATGADGTAQFCYAGAKDGFDTVTASAGGVSDTAMRTWTPQAQPPPTLTASPKAGSGTVGTQQCVTATVGDASGAPLPGATVTFTVTGANSTSGSVQTAGDGTARFCYVGTNAGDDTVTVSTGTASESVTRTWTAPASTSTETATSGSTETGTTAATSTAQSPSGPRSDVAVAVTGPAYARVGSNVTFDDTVSNNGPDAATGVELRAPVPAGTSLVSAKLSNGNTCTTGAGTVTCFVGTLGPGGSAGVVFIVTANQTGSATQTATVQGDYDTNPSNNSASATTPIIALDAAPPPPPKPAQPGTFNAIATGTVTVNGVTVAADQVFVLHAGDVVDVTNGTITITDFDGGSGTFGNVEPTPRRRSQSRSGPSATASIPAIFTIQQAPQAGAGVTLTLSGGDFSVCGSPRRTAVAKQTPVRQLWGKAHGLFTTKARYSSATIRGTIWLTQDRCDGSLTTAVDDVVDVVDFVKNTTITLQPGQSYLAQPKQAAFKPPATKKSGHGLLTQTAATVARNGLIWGNQTFLTRADFTTWLVQRGATWNQFASNHPDLAGALTARG